MNNKIKPVNIKKLIDILSAKMLIADDWIIFKIVISYVISQIVLLKLDMDPKALADLGGGGVPGAHPQGSRFFRFAIQNFRNVTPSRVHAPPYEVHAPYGKSWIRHWNGRNICVCWIQG